MLLGLPPAVSLACVRWHLPLVIISHEKFEIADTIIFIIVFIIAYNIVNNSVICYIHNNTNINEYNNVNISMNHPCIVLFLPFILVLYSYLHHCTWWNRVREFFHQVRNNFLDVVKANIFNGGKNLSPKV